VHGASRGRFELPEYIPTLPVDIGAMVNCLITDNY